MDSPAPGFGSPMESFGEGALGMTPNTSGLLTEKRLGKRARVDCNTSLGEVKLGEGTCKLVTENYAKGVWETWHELYKKELFCDVILKVGEVSIKAHRIVLATQSRMFHGCFTLNMAEQQKLDLDVSHLVDEYSLRTLLEYMYTGEVSVEADCLQDVLVAADKLAIMGCYDLCVQFLSDQLDTSNCIDMLTFARDAGCQPLIVRSHEMLVANLATIADAGRKGGPFTTLDSSALVSLLSDPQVEVGCENEVWDYILIWARADEKERFPLVGHIVAKCLRLHKVTPECLVEIARVVPAEGDIQEFQQALQTVYTYREATEEEQKVMIADGLLLGKRKHRVRPSLWCLGGTDNTKFRETVLCFSADKMEWEDKAPMVHARCGFGVVYLNGFLFALGGKSTTAGKSMNSVEKYDIEKDEWSSCAPMCVPRRYHGVAVLNGMIYAIGGGNANETLRSVERYNFKTDSWSMVASLSDARKCVSATVADGKIYAVGGFSGRTLRTVEAYDPNTDTWEHRAKLNVKRQFHGCCVLDGKIYAVGGNGNGRVQSQEGEHSVERYDPAQDTWTHVAPMKIPRSFLGVAVMGGHIYTVGGHAQVNNAAPPTEMRHIMVSVEKYDAELDTWTLLEEKSLLPGPRSASGCVGIK